MERLRQISERITELTAELPSPSRPAAKALPGTLQLQQSARVFGGTGSVPSLNIRDATERVPPSGRLSQSPLPGIQFDDQLLVDHRLHLFARWDVRYLAAQRITIRDQPIRHGRDLCELEIA